MIKWERLNHQQQTETINALARSDGYVVGMQMGQGLNPDLRAKYEDDLTATWLRVQGDKLLAMHGAEVFLVGGRAYKTSAYDQSREVHVQFTFEQLVQNLEALKRIFGV